MKLRCKVNVDITWSGATFAPSIIQGSRTIFSYNLARVGEETSRLLPLVKTLFMRREFGSSFLQFPHQKNAKSGFPLGLENLEKWEGIFQSGKSRGILNRLEKSENHTKYWKTEINWDKYYLIFLVIFKWTVHFLVKWIKFSVKKNKTLKKYWKNGQKYWKSQGKVREFCQSGKVGTLEIPLNLHV